MATIVQPYNPWREQLALTALGNVAGNIIGDIWKTHRQNEQNRKANAFRGQLQQDLQNAAQPDISLMPKEAPQGYNSNPWANAFHQNNSPLTAFDIGTSTVGKTPSIQDIVQGADSLAASKRFSMLSPELVQGVKNSMIQQAENQRLRDLQNNFADMFGNAKSPAEQMRALVLANLHGFGDKAIAPFGSFAAHMSPHKQAIETDTGNTKRIDAFDPLTGNITPGAAYNVTVSPNTAATVAGSQNVAKINAGSAENVARIHALGDEARAQATVHAQQLKIWQEQHKALSEEIANDTANLAGLNEQEAIAMQSIINQKKQRLAQLEQLMSGAYSGADGSQATQGQTGKQNIQGIAKSNYDDLITSASKTHGVDQDLIYAVMQIESGHKNGLTSNKGAQGLMQLMPDTAKRWGVTDPWNPEQNINGGVAYLKWLLDRYGGNEEKALQAYHCGEGRVAREGTKDKNNVPAVSVQYAKNVLAIANKRRAARQANSKNQNTAQPTTTQTQPQTTAQPTTQGQQNTTKSPVTAYVNEFDPYAYISTDDGNSYSKAEIERLAKSQGLTLDEWLKKNDVQPYPDWGLPTFMENTRKQTPRDPVAYMSDSYGNYFTLDEVQREAARKNISLDEYEKQLREQGFSKAGEEANNETTQAPLTALTEAQPVPPFPDSYSDKNRRNSPQNTAGNPHAGVSQGNFSNFFSVPWGSFDIHQPILGGQRQQPLPQQQPVSNDSRLSPLFSGKAINAASDFLKGLNLTSGDENAVIPSMHEKGFFQYTDNPIPNDPRYNPHVSFPQGLPAGNAYNPQPGEFPNNFSDKNRRNFIPDIPTGYYRGGVETRPWSFADWFNRYANNEISFRPPLSALSYAQNPSNKSLRYYSGNMAGGLLPENAYDREKIDGEYQFLDTQLTALNGGLPYWYGGPLSDDAYQLNFLLNSLGVTADKYPYIKRY